MGGEVRIWDFSPLDTVISILTLISDFFLIFFGVSTRIFHPPPFPLALPYGFPFPPILFLGLFSHFFAFSGDVSTLNPYRKFGFPHSHPQFSWGYFQNSPSPQNPGGLQRRGQGIFYFFYFFYPNSIPSSSFHTKFFYLFESRRFKGSTSVCRPEESNS